MLTTIFFASSLCHLFTSSSLNTTVNTEVFTQNFAGFASYSTAVISRSKPCSTFYVPQNRLVHMNILIHEFSGNFTGGESVPFNENGLECLETLFEVSRERNATLITRFQYDSGTGTENSEPDISLILTHLDQASKIMNEHADIILAADSGFLGKWAEEHTGVQVTRENREKLYDAWTSKLDSSIHVLTRTPKFVYEWMGMTTEDLSSGKTNKKLGTFNDAYLSCDDDMGTYRNRDVEVAWLSETINNWHPFGGEMSEFSTWTVPPLHHNASHALIESRNLRLYYLNEKYNLKSLSHLKTMTVPEDVIPDKEFKGVTVYDYLATHMGVRFHVSSLAYSPTIVASGIVDVRMDIQNFGFCDPLFEKEAMFFFSDDDVSIPVRSNLDWTKWTRGTNTVETQVEIPSYFLPGSSPLLTLRIGRAGYHVVFSNSDCMDERTAGLIIGPVSVLEPSKAADLWMWLGPLIGVIVLFTIFILIILVCLRKKQF
ncbi:putative dockerin type 1 [Blattamonas nauphoetae]|uniref:Dockerin type 1 n=1 Tax=Blattamonas nauphoetae TaxID=2049346 RepID=A0ABQ9Y2Z1_9EUKA|nr:putative dockerin type 1 [Blattamonas nauphoetae]